MVITRTKTLENNIYYVEIKVTDLTIQEKDLLKTYGDPMIDLGGNFGTFSVPHYYRKLYENSPHKYYNEDESKVTTWLNSVEERIQTAITMLKNLSNSNKWSGTIVYPFWTGSDIKYKDGSTETIANKIDNNIIKVIAKTGVNDNMDCRDLIPAGHLLTNIIVKNTSDNNVVSLFIRKMGEKENDIISAQEIDAFNFFTCPVMNFYPENTSIYIYADFWNSASLDIYFVLIKIY